MTLAAIALISLAGTARPARAQNPEPPTDAPVQVGPLVLAPVIRLSDIGYDSNVYNRDDASDPVGDVTTTLSPSTVAWLRLPHARLNARTQFDLYWFKELSDLRAVDSDTAARLELPLNRIIPFVSGNLTNTRHRQNLEIDAIARRRNEGVSAGADVRLTAKVTIGAFVQRSRLAYEPNSLYLSIDLARELNHTSAGEGILFQYSLTPFTTFSLEVERERDRFTSVSDRDADSLRVTPVVTFNPMALVSGRASIGFRKRTFLSGSSPDFNGTTAFADLVYTFRGETRFAVTARRELEYSYLVGVSDYVDAEIGLSVTQRLGDSWDVGGNIGRGRISYSTADGAASGLPSSPDETVFTSGADAGYTFGRARVGFHFERRTRQNDLPMLFRGYERFRIGSTLTYTF